LSNDQIAGKTGVKTGTVKWIISKYRNENKVNKLKSGNPNLGRKLSDDIIR